MFGCREWRAAMNFSYLSKYRDDFGMDGGLVPPQQFMLES